MQFEQICSPKKTKKNEAWFFFTFQGNYFFYYHQGEKRKKKSRSIENRRCVCDVHVQNEKKIGNSCV